MSNVNDTCMYCIYRYLAKELLLRGECPKRPLAAILERERILLPCNQWSTALDSRHFLPPYLQFSFFFIYMHYLQHSLMFSLYIHSQLNNLLLAADYLIKFIWFILAGFLVGDAYFLGAPFDLFFLVRVVS